MKNKLSHIIFSYLLIGVMVLPPLLQLEHIFDNDHGIVYRLEGKNIQNHTNTYCGDLHKIMHFVYIQSSQTIRLNPPTPYFSIDESLTDNYYRTFVRFLSLRAPPYLA